MLIHRPVPQSNNHDGQPRQGRRLQDQFDAQRARLREIHKAQRPKNTTKAYESKQKERQDWCAKLEGNIDDSWVTENKLCLFLEQQVINHESRASPQPDTNYPRSLFLFRR